MTRADSIAIIDVGCGNSGNLSNALEYLNLKFEVLESKNHIADFERFILPGVGAFPFFMRKLRQLDLIEPLQRIYEEGRYILGICLGMQVFYDFSEEHNHNAGLSWVGGAVRKFNFHGSSRLYKIPHISWENISLSANQSDIASRLFESIDPESKYYFLHSYSGWCDDRSNVAGIAQYGNVEFDAVIKVNNAIGVQFHPELSAEAGLKLLRNFASLK